MFQSTHSLRSATKDAFAAGSSSTVSIHALLAECDISQTNFFIGFICFNPRTPCGVRLICFRQFFTSERFQSTHSLRSATRFLPVMAGWGRFQSTHSLRSATKCGVCGKSGKTVSIHALLAECDSPVSRSLVHPQRFNPRTPCGVRLYMFPAIFHKQKVSIHALLAECDTKPEGTLGQVKVSIHALLAECDCA